jgi:TPR repeat protein
VEDHERPVGPTHSEWIARCIEIADANLPGSKESAEQFARREFTDALALAKKGSTLAQYRVAECYLIGHGVPRDLLTGYAWMWISAEGGNDEAERCLAEADLEDDQQAMVLNLVASVMPASAND